MKLTLLISIFLILMSAYTPAFAAKAVQADLLQKYRPKMVLIQGGSYKMDYRSVSDDRNNGPVVEIKAFEIGETEVTQAQWRAVMGKDPDGLRFKGCDNCPVESVNYAEVQQYIKKLNQLTDEIYRLPTEAEWEYAARQGGKEITYPWGDEEPVCEPGAFNGARFDDRKDCNRKTTKGKGTVEVKAYQAHGGLYGMVGNVGEWTCSAYSMPYKKSKASSCSDGGNGHDWSDSDRYIAIRGGSWYMDWRGLRAAIRYSYKPTFGNGLVGFRLFRIR